MPPAPWASAAGAGRERRDWSHVVDEYLAIYDRVLGSVSATVSGAPATSPAREWELLMLPSPALLQGRALRALG